MEDFIETHLCKLRGILRSCAKQNRDAVWSLVLLLVAGVRADPKYSYSHMISYAWCVREDCYFWFFMAIFHFCSRYLVLGTVVDTIFFLGFNNMQRDTCRSDFVRYQAKTWKQPCVAFRGQGDAAVRQIANMNDSYGCINVNYVWPH